MANKDVFLQTETKNDHITEGMKNKNFRSPTSFTLPQIVGFCIYLTLFFLYNSF